MVLCFPAGHEKGSSSERGSKNLNPEIWESRGVAVAHRREELN